MKPAYIWGFVISLLLSAPAHAATTTLSEADFAPGSVTTVSLFSLGSQHIAGPESNALVVLTDGNEVVRTAHFMSALSFQPGAFDITSIDVSFDYTPINAFGQGQGLGIVLRQSGRTYIVSGVSGAVQAVPQTFSAPGMTAQAWVEISGLSTLAGKPDYAAGADLMEFGLYNFNSGGDTIRVSYDNFEVAITTAAPVPLPAGLPLLAFGLFASGMLLRARKAL